MFPSSKELSVFLEVCLTGNLSRASERLGMSQPALSQAIKRLESMMGVGLFIRQKNGVKLTQAAKRLQTESQHLLRQWNKVSQACIDVENTVAGKINFGIHASIANAFLPKWLPQLLSQYPQLSLSFSHDLSRKILEQLVSLNLDLAIVVNPIAHPDLVLIKLYDDQVTFFSARNNQQPKTLICANALHQTQSLLQRSKQKGFEFSQVIETDNLELVAKLTEQHLGVGILPASIARAVTHNALVELEGYPAYKDEIYLCFRAESRNIKAIKVLCQAIKQHLQTPSARTPT